MDDLLSLASIIATVGGLAVSAAFLIPVYYEFLAKRKNPFLFHRFKESLTKPIESNWSIRILYPTKPIEECQILWNKISLPWSDNPNSEQLVWQRMILAYGGGVVRVPKSLEKMDGTVKVKDGKKTLRTKKFSKLPIVPLEMEFLWADSESLIIINTLHSPKLSEEEI